MNHKRMARLEKGPAAEVRRIALSLVQPRAEHLPAASEVRAQLREALPEADEARLGQVYDALVKFAKAAIEGADRIELRSKIDEWTVAVSKAWENDDRLLPVEGDEAVDVKAALESIDGFDPTQRRLTMADHAARQAADIESAMRLAGGQS